MAGWDRDSVARSIRRYWSVMLDTPPWDLRTERREVRDDQRPVAVIDLGNGIPTRGRDSLEQGEIETTYPCTVSAYPPVGVEPREARMVADRLATQFELLLTVGTPVLDGDDRLRSGPCRIPLWDYSAAEFSGEDRAGAEFPHDVIWVERESIRADSIQDQEDADRFTVVVDFRASVEHPGRVKDPDAPLVGGVGPATWGGEPTP